MSVEVINVTRTFRGAPAVRGLSVSVPSGAVTGLVGPNGAGKTTLLLMLAALLRPDTGTIRVNGLDPVTQPREVHRVVGWMPDSFGTWDSLTCTEILQTFAVAQGVETREAAGRAGPDTGSENVRDGVRRLPGPWVAYSAGSLLFFHGTRRETRGARARSWRVARAANGS